jgi:signal transduction histidine kinase
VIDPLQPDSDRLHRVSEAQLWITSELDLDGVLHRVLEAARDLTGARYAALGVLREGGKELDPDRFLTLGIDESTRREIGESPRGRGVLGVLIENPQPVRLADIGSHPESVGFPGAHPPMRSFLGVPVHVLGEHWSNLYLAEKAEGEFDAADERAVVLLSKCAGAAINNAQAYSVEREHRAVLQRAAATLEATTSIAVALAGETDLQRVLELIVKRARALVDARAMLIVLVERDEIVVAATTGDYGADHLGRRFALKDSAVEYAIAGGRPVRLDELPASAHPAMLEGDAASDGMVVPLLFRGRAVGAIAAFDRITRGPQFDDEDLRLIGAFAASAAIAVGSAQTISTETLRLTVDAAERERTRWARALHDGAIQDLAAVQGLLSEAQRQPEPEQLRRLLDQAVDRVAVGIDGVHSLIADLRPAALDELGLQPALETLVRRTGALSGLRVELTVDLAYEQGRSPTRLTSVVEETVYRVIQEALTNVVKHADAGSATVELAESDVVSITVRDDGRGFDTHAQDRGFGLLGLEERVAFLGGKLALESSPAGGTTLRAEVPAERSVSVPA